MNDDKHLSNTDVSKIILEVTGYADKVDLFLNKLEKELKILQCYLSSLGQNHKWQDFLESINQLPKENSALLTENEPFKLILKEMLGVVQKLLRSNTTNPFLTSDAILKWFAISDKKVKKSETIAGNIQEDLIKKCTSSDFFTQDTLLLISNSRNTMSVRFNHDEALYECYSQKTDSTEKISAHPELVAFLKKNVAHTMKLEWVTWNETTDLSTLQRYKNELISKHALALLSENGLHFLAQNARSELKNILEQAKENNTVSDAVAKALITTDKDKWSGLLSMARHAGDQIETLFTLAERHEGIRKAFAQALLMVDVNNRTGFYVIIQLDQVQLRPLLELAKKYKNIGIAIAEALIQYSEASTGFYYVVINYGRKEVADLFALAKKYPEMNDLIAKALVMKNHAGLTGLSAVAASRNAQDHLTTLLQLAENNEVIQDAIADALSITCKKNRRNGYFSIARFGSVAQLKTLHALSENHERLKKVISEIESIEQGVLGQKMSLFMALAAGKPFFEDEGNKREMMDYDYGLAILYSYMNATGKLAWWIRSLQKFNKWDGTKESFYEKDVNISDVSLLPLEKTESYILYKRITDLLNNQLVLLEGSPEVSRGKNINLFLKPLLEDENIQTNESRFFSGKTHIVQHVIIAGHFDKALLKRLLVGQHFALEAIYLLRNNGHQGSIRYSIEKERWYLYNPNCPNEMVFNDDDDGKSSLIDELYAFHRWSNQSISIEIATWRKDLDLRFLSTFYESLSDEEMLSLFQGTGLHEVARWAPEHLPKFLEFAKREDRAKDAIALAMSQTTIGQLNLLQTISECAASQFSTWLELANTHEGIKNSILSTPSSIIHKIVLSPLTPPDVLFALSRIAAGISFVEEIPPESAVVLPKV